VKPAAITRFRSAVRNVCQGVTRGGDSDVKLEGNLRFLTPPIGVLGKVVCISSSFTRHAPRRSCSCCTFPRHEIPLPAHAPLSQSVDGRRVDIAVFQKKLDDCQKTERLKNSDITRKSPCALDFFCLCRTAALARWTIRSVSERDRYLSMTTRKGRTTNSTGCAKAFTEINTGPNLMAQRCVERQ